MTKIKIFEDIVYYPRYNGVETKVNDFIVLNPNIEIIKIEFQMNRIIDWVDSNRYYVAIWILIYKE